MKLVAEYIEVEPGAGLTVTVTVNLDTLGKVLRFAWDTARKSTVAAWWHRPAIFGGLMVYGTQRLVSR